MDRKEAIQTLSKVGKISVSYAEDLYDSFFPKPVVSQVVADWYEGNKECFDYRLWDYIKNWDYQSSSDFKSWIDNRKNAFQTLVNMHQFGYEVEKEPRYTVRVKGIDGYSKYLNKDLKSQRWFFASKTELERFRTHHTRKELEANGFGWVFNCEGIEIKEVE